MPETEKLNIDLASYLESTSSLIEQLGKSFTELEADEDASSDDIQWSEVEGHFRHLESVLKKKLEDLEAKENEYNHKETLLAERQASVTSKEQDLLDRVQELKDAAVDAILQARAQNKVSCSIYDENGPRREGVSAEAVAEVREKLTQFCEGMDSKGLLKYVIDNLSDLSSICREQLSVVLGSASEPALLVLDAVEGFFPPSEMNPDGENGDDALHGMRQSCLVLLEALFAFLAKADDSSADNFLKPEIKQHAKAIADEWKPKVPLESDDSKNGKSLEARGFLRLLVTFRISSEFDKEELCKYVLATAHHRHATEICRSLDLSQKISGLVETLIDNGRQIEAVNFTLSFNLSEAYPPVPLLKSYLKDVRRNLQGNGDAELQNIYNARELAAIKAVIRCVKEYKLEAEYPLDQLRKRFIQLQNSVWDRKRKRDRDRDRDRGNKRQQQKESPKDDGVFKEPETRVAGSVEQGPPSFIIERPAVPYTGLAERYSPAIPSAYNYPVSSQPTTYATQPNDQSAYSYPVTSQPTATYAPVANDQVSYYYAQDNGAVAPTYGAYMQPSNQPYM